MSDLIQTEKCSIIYGTFRGQENQELFRCPRELDNTDLRRYVNENRCFLGFEDDDTPDLRNVEGKVMIGYWRMYFRDGRWYGRWMIEWGNVNVNTRDCVGIDEIANWFMDNFDKGCDYFMEDYFYENFKHWGGNKRYLVKPKYSDYYKVMVDTTYGNGDYPVRIYVYRDKED